MDPEVQNQAEADIRRPHEPGTTLPRATVSSLQSAITVIDNETGDIAGLAGPDR
ncbi:MAG: hypothetical protein ACLUJG_07280 [Lawsonibacter sp.]